MKYLSLCVLQFFYFFFNGKCVCFNLSEKILYTQTYTTETETQTQNSSFFCLRKNKKCDDRDLNPNLLSLDAFLKLSSQ